MNWNPLKRPSLNRPALDPSTQNANLALERLLNEFDSAENTAKSLYISVKKLPDHLLCAGNFEIKLTDELLTSSLFANDEFMRNVIEDWNSFTLQSNTIGDEYVINIQKTLIDPIKRLKLAFSGLRSAIKLHESKQFNLIKHQKRVASLSDKEKTGPNLVKLEQSKKLLSNAQSDFAHSTQVLLNDLSKFITGSVEMLKPLLEAFIAAETAWVKACQQSLESKSDLTTNMEEQNVADRLKSINDTMNRINTLSICVDNK